MRLRFVVRNAVLPAVVCALGATPNLAQVAIPEGYDVGTHIVRSGDTLRELTKAYLGSEELWEQNWRLNPHVEDPDLLFPLQRLKVLVAPRTTRSTARLTTISGDVDGKPAPSDWYPSEEDDLMIERDGVRAGEDSSTVMEFSDGSQLTVKDDSTIFLRVAGRSLQGFEQRSVEIVRGGADLAAASLPVETEIEVVIGSTIATPRTAADGGLETRARKAETGGAQVMVFAGAGEVVAAGQSVELEQGTGTAVPEAGPPSPPEKLLPAVVGLAPEAEGEVEVGRDLSWTPVEGAASYTVELCRDRKCGNLVTRQTGLSQPRWADGDLPLGEFLWRVNAVSESGLDGYSSASQVVTIVPFRLREPPLAFEF